tara:strand:+ start:331 stop:759 length:429 start_codon:yes stop_codon:yes gene_type:complete
MKNLSTIENNIIKSLKLSNVKNYGSSEVDQFTESAKRYIKAIKQGRIICNIESVSASGMSRNIKFMECNGTTKNGFSFFNFFKLFKDLGYKNAKNSNSFKISGCGMDMVFATNYNIIHKLKNLGFLSPKDCAALAQKTPNVI